MDNIDKTKEGLEDILSQEEYQIYYQDNRSLLEIWWDQIKEWFRELLSNLAIPFNPSNGFADTLLVILIGAVLIVVLVALYLIVRTIKRKRTFRDHQPIQSINELEWSVQRHLEEAKKQEEKQNYFLSTRHMFLALLLYFHERDWLVAKVWKTNWEYYDELQKVNQGRATTFYRLAHFFDEVVYGEREMEEIDYIQYRDEIMRLIEDTEEQLVK